MNRKYYYASTYLGAVPQADRRLGLSSYAPVWNTNSYSLSSIAAVRAVDHVSAVRDINS